MNVIFSSNPKIFTKFWNILPLILLWYSKYTQIEGQDNFNCLQIVFNTEVHLLNEIEFTTAFFFFFSFSHFCLALAVFL